MVEKPRGTLSNGNTRILTLKKSPEGKGQSFDLGGFVITSLMLDNLKKADDPSPFPALTQLEVGERMYAIRTCDFCRTPDVYADDGTV